MTYSCVCGTKANVCDCPVVIECNCVKDKNPSIERKFINNQRTTRIAFIDSLDNKETEKLQKGKKRKQQNVLQETVSIDNDTCKMKITRKSLNERRDEIDLSSSPSAYQMRSKFNSTALVSDRFGVSDRAAAVIASSVLHDLGMSSEKDTSLVIDESKIRREKQKTRQAIGQIMDQLIVTKGIYFDGRKENTIFQEKVGTKIYRRIRKEEHIIVIPEPGAQCVGHVTPASGTGSDIAKCILKNLEDNNVDNNELEVIGCDDTATNTGWKNGVIRNIELKL
ncbi:hypothetical protein AVEN_41479-1 [Araneus ventricosus]|uniref:Uncharacterized protein n=1 Tax=Araneus ventricosus TaxID=182803 RepID=A0A4Y2F089_ARAVE|nr:hypothetical protein AVEN_41479-1 [Araneus ventricosus]